MDPKTPKSKLDRILEAIAAGRGCDEILTSDRTLSYHDIFHALAEAPTCFWRKAAETKPVAQPPQDPIPFRAWHRID